MTSKKSAEQKTGNSTETIQQKPKRRNYKKDLEKALLEKAELKDQLLRKVAEFDNFRKRSTNEKLDLISQANADLVASLLPVLDDFDRLNQVNEESSIESLRQGFDMISKNFRKILENQGLVHMEAVGQPFDPEKHDALMQVEEKNVDPETVVKVHQEGYEFNGRVVRHAKVIVSK